MTDARTEGRPPPSGAVVETDIPERTDVAVVGGGPAGATTAALLARAGLEVACFERERFPRFHVGESLLPASMPLFDRLGVRGRLESAGLLKKYGATFIDDDENRRLTFNFRPGPAWTDHAYNVPRADLDHVLLRQAAADGTRVFEGTTVEGLALGDDGVRLTVRPDGGEPRPVRARFLIDASGRDALAASRLGRRQPMPDLGKVALFAHVRGGERWADRLEGHIRIVLFSQGWIWWIPFANDVASVGVVLHRRAVKDRTGTLEALFDETTQAAPSVRQWLAGAQRITPVHPVANFSYRAEPASGSRWTAVGDAVAFVDPIFSTGVFVAMQSGVLTADALIAGWRRGGPGAIDLSAVHRQLREGTTLFFEFIERYYDPAFLDVFFATSPPPLVGTLARLAFQTMLAGGAFVRRPPWVRLGLNVMRLATWADRRARRGRDLPVESRFHW
jgi:flavin-dependent dehydrogenase